MHMDIALIGVPIDLGANRRGVDMGPSALRYAGLQKALSDLGHTVADLGDLVVPGPEHSDPGHPSARYLKEIVEVCRELSRRVADVVKAGRVPLVLGGDHSLSVGTVSGVRQVHPNTGIIWLDAHGDFNTPDTTPSGNVHGMSLAALLGLGAEELVACSDGAAGAAGADRAHRGAGLGRRGAGAAPKDGRAGFHHAGSGSARFARRHGSSAGPAAKARRPHPPEPGLGRVRAGFGPRGRNAEVGRPHVPRRALGHGDDRGTGHAGLHGAGGGQPDTGRGQSDGAGWPWTWRARRWVRKCCSH